MMRLNSIIDIKSVDDAGYSADDAAVARIVKAAIECGFLFPPIVVVEGFDDDSYELAIGINHLEAAKKLCFKKGEEFGDRILCFIVSKDDVELMRSQLEYFGDE